MPDCSKFADNQKEQPMNYNLITILGPTAGGKTAIAAGVANALNSEIISADSRQVYKHMNLGTGKDYSDYIIENKPIPYHLIDIEEPGEKYNLYRFQTDFKNAFELISAKNKLPILCGGTGMYIESVLKSYNLPLVPDNEPLRTELETYSHEALIERLKELHHLHNTTDTDNRKRLIRAIEIAEYIQETGADNRSQMPKINSLTIGINYETETRRNRITERLRTRLNEGMIEEISDLLKKGISAEMMIFYGLEYKFVTQFILGEISKPQLFEQLNIAIHQFAKRQMTWFRGMERRGIPIIWLKGENGTAANIKQILTLI